MISWFSNGAASAVATMMMIDAEHDVRIIRTETNSEHPDSNRFQADCEKWFGQKVEVIHNGKHKDVNAVIESRNFLRGPQGAPCTLELKKKVRWAVGSLKDVHVFGYTCDEPERAERFKNANPEYKLKFPLIEAGLTKNDCFRVLETVGIELPEMYKLGFKNNNCIGCVKAESPGYWLAIKKHFPDVFLERAAQERSLGYALTRITRHGKKVAVFLDELEYQLSTLNDVEGQQKLDLGIPSCDFLCGELKNA